MKTTKAFSFVFILGLLAVSCEKENPEPVKEINDQATAFVVPEIPEDFAALMSDEDQDLFTTGPGEEYLEKSALKSGLSYRGRWHPVLMLLEYHLQLFPVSSCIPGEVSPCIDFTTGEYICPGPPAGYSGVTVADGNWFCYSIHSEYFPVFCLPDHEGYGQGFYQVGESFLWMRGENTPFQEDEQGNLTFRRNGQYSGEQSTGIFEGARGWEVMISYTAAENNPGNSPTGEGSSTVLIYGWVYY